MFLSLPLGLRALLPTPSAFTLALAAPSAHASVTDTTGVDFPGLDIFIAMNIALLGLLIALPSILPKDVFEDRKNKKKSN